MTRYALSDTGTPPTRSRHGAVVRNVWAEGQLTISNQLRGLGLGTRDSVGDRKQPLTLNPCRDGHMWVSPLCNLRLVLGLAPFWFSIRYSHARLHMLHARTTYICICMQRRWGCYLLFANEATVPVVARGGRAYRGTGTGPPAKALLLPPQFEFRCVPPA